MERLPTWCSRFCKNSLTDVCIEDCAVSRKMDHFKIKEFTFDDLPHYPLQDFENMTKEEKAYSLAIYTAKVTEKLQEVENGQYNKARQVIYYSRSSTLPKDFQKQGVLSGKSKENPTPTDSKKRKDI